MGTNTAKESINLVWQWVSKALMVAVAVIGFFIANTLSAISESRKEADKERDKIRQEINEIQQQNAVSEERFIYIQKTLEKIEEKL